MATNRRALILAVFFLGLSAPAPALAAQPEEPASRAVPCAILDKFGGNVQIMDPTRTHLLETGIGAAVPCGSWLVVLVGWGELKHRQGHVIKLGSQTLAQVFDNYDGKHATGDDQVVLYRGKVYANVGEGASELRVATANAKARLKKGLAMVLYSRQDEETQLISLKHEASLENRFQPGSEIVVRDGEATALNFRALRTVPSTPRAVNVAQLKKELFDLNLTPRDYRAAVRSAERRASRKFPSIIGKGDLESRGLASVTGANYQQHVAAPGDEVAQEKFEEALVGGAKSGKPLLRPKARKSAQRDPAQEMERKRVESERAEKKKLIQKLSELRPQR